MFEIMQFVLDWCNPGSANHPQVCIDMRGIGESHNMGMQVRLVVVIYHLQTV